MTEDKGQAIAILAELSALGVAVRMQDGRLHLQPSSRVTPHLRQQLMEYKAGIIEVLKGESEIYQDPEPFTDVLPRYRPYMMTRRVLKDRGFRAMTEIPEVVLALTEVAEGIAVELRRRGN